MESPVSKESPAIFAQFVPKPYAEFFLAYMFKNEHIRWTTVLMVSRQKYWWSISQKSLRPKTLHRYICDIVVS